MVSRHGQLGLTYLWMLFLVFLLGLGLGKSLEVYSTVLKREKEAELLYVGGLYREAIRQYYLSSPGSMRRFPATLEDLLKDPRSLVTRRYLRHLIPDPISGEKFVPVVAPQGGIWGVRSPSSSKPLKISGFAAPEASFEGKLSYSEWQFIYGGNG